MDADSSYGGSDTAQDSHSGHDNSSSLETTHNDNSTSQPNNFYHKNEITLPVNYDDETDFHQDHKPIKQPHYLSTANLNINDTLEHHNNLEEMSKNYKSTNYLNESREKSDQNTGLDNPAFQDEDHKHEVKSTFDNTKPYNGDLNSSAALGLTSPNKNDEPMTEAVNLELINLKPTGKDVTGAYENGNGMTSIPVKKENEAEIGNPYDEYFVPVNEHRKYMRGEKLYVTMDKRNKKKRNKCLCWGICLCLVAAAVIIGILAAVGVIGNHGPHQAQEVSARHFGSSTNEPEVKAAGGIFGLPKDIGETTTQRILTPGPPVSTVSNSLPPTDTSMIQVPRALESQLTVDNLDFTPALTDKNSTEYKKLAEALETELKNSLFSSDVLNYGAADIEVKVMDFSRGSVVVKYRITWTFKDGIHSAKDPIDEETLKRKMRNVLDKNSGFMDTYHIVGNTVTVDRITDLCKIDNNECEYSCSFDYKIADFICSCPEGKYLGHDQKRCTDEPEHVHHLVEPSAEPTTEHVHHVHFTEPSAEPTAEPVTEPVPVYNYDHFNHHHEYIPKTNPEPTSKPEPPPEDKTNIMVEPLPEPTSEPEPEPTNKPEDVSHENYINVHLHETGANPEPHAEPTAEPQPEPTAEPNAEHEMKPKAEPTAEPTSEHQTEPNAEPNPGNEVRVITEPLTEPKTEPNAEPTSEHQTEPSAEPKPETEVKVLTEMKTEPSAEPSSENQTHPSTLEHELDHIPVIVPVSEPSSEPTAEPTAEPSSEHQTHPPNTLEHDISHIPVIVPVSEPSPEPTTLEPATTTPIVVHVSISSSEVVPTTEPTLSSVQPKSSTETSESRLNHIWDEIFAEPETTTTNEENHFNNIEETSIKKEMPSRSEEATTFEPVTTHVENSVSFTINNHNEIAEAQNLTGQNESHTIPITVNDHPVTVQVEKETSIRPIIYEITTQPTDMKKIFTEIHNIIDHSTEIIMPLQTTNQSHMNVMSDSIENTSAMDNMSPFLPEIDNDTFVNKLHLGEHVIPHIQNETHEDEMTDIPPRLDNDQMNTTNPQDLHPVDASLKVVPLEGGNNEVLDRVVSTEQPQTLTTTTAASEPVEANKVEENVPLISVASSTTEQTASTTKHLVVAVEETTSESIAAEDNETHTTIKSNDIAQPTIKPDDVIQTTIKPSEVVQTTTKSSDALQTTMKTDAIVETTIKTGEVAEITIRHDEVTETTNKSVEAVQMENSTMKHDEIVLNAISPVEAVPETTVKPAETVAEITMKPAETVTETAIKSAELVNNATDTVMKPAEVFANTSSKPSETAGEVTTKSPEIVQETTIRPVDIVAVTTMKSDEVVPVITMKSIEVVPVTTMKPVENVVVTTIEPIESPAVTTMKSIEIVPSSTDKPVEIAANTIKPLEVLTEITTEVVTEMTNNMTKPDNVTENAIKPVEIVTTIKSNEVASEVQTTLPPEIINNVHSNTYFDKLEEALKVSKQENVTERETNASTEDLLALETTTHITNKNAMETTTKSTKVNETFTTIHAEVVDTVTESINFTAKQEPENTSEPATEDKKVHQYEVQETVADITTTEKLFLTTRTTTETPIIAKTDYEDLSVIPLNSQVVDDKTETKRDDSHFNHLETETSDSINDISIEEQSVLDKFHHHNEISDNYTNLEIPKKESHDEILTTSVPTDKEISPYSDVKPVTEDYSIPPFSRCLFGQFQCANGTSIKDGSYCINGNDRCDNVDDCTDGSDEIDCGGCPNNFQCGSGQCLKRHLVCDGIQNCNDGTDEVNCDNWTCRFDEFSCGDSHRCLPVTWKCDGRRQCRDGSDENNCPSSMCNENTFKCEEQNTCIPTTWRCDGKTDCVNSEDERACTCGKEQFKCALGGGCIEGKHRCDGIDHCPDRSDEWNCLVLEEEKKKYLQIEVSNGTWYPVCSDHWNQTHSDQVCRDLGYSGASATETVNKPTGDYEGYLKLKLNPRYGSTILEQLDRSNDSCNAFVSVTCQEFVCGSHSTHDVQSARIVGGHQGTESQWPSLTLLYNSKLNRQCTATLIAPSWVIASHSCIFDNVRFNPSVTDWALYAGGTNFSGSSDNSTTQMRDVQKIVPHPQAKFSQFEFINDVALVELTRPLTLTRNVSAVCLPDHDIEPRQLCVVAGWGISQPGEPEKHQYLLYLPVPVIDSQECNSTKHYNGLMNDDKICAGYTDSDRTPCYNDEGAPLMCFSDSAGTWELQGILSHHDNCARSKHPAIYTSINDKIRKWVINTIGQKPERSA